LVFDTIENSARLHRYAAQEINNKPVLFFDPDIQTIEDVIKANDQNRLKSGDYTLFGLPPNLHLLTFMKDYDSVEKNALIVRIEHFFEQNEDPVLSKPVRIDIGEFLSVFNVVGVEELALGANMPVENLNERLKWNQSPSVLEPKLKTTKLGDFSFEFQPMQIRTFRVFFNLN